MKNFSRLVLVPLVFLAFTGLSFAQATPETPSSSAPEKKMEKTQKKATKSKVSKVTGEVVSADSKAGTLTVKAEDKDMNFTAQSKSAKNALNKVKAGDNVSVSYTEKDGNMVIRSVSKAKAKSKAAAKEGKTSTKSESKTETK